MRIPRGNLGRVGRKKTLCPVDRNQTCMTEGLHSYRMRMTRYAERIRLARNLIVLKVPGGLKKTHEEVTLDFLAESKVLLEIPGHDLPTGSIERCRRH